MALGAMIARRGFDLDARKELEQLRENTTYSIQGGIPHSLRLLSEKPIQASRDSALLAQTLIWTSLRPCRVSTSTAFLARGSWVDDDLNVETWHCHVSHCPSRGCKLQHEKLLPPHAIILLSRR